MTGRASVAVHILGKPYRVRSDRDEQSIVRVAEMVDQTMGRIRERTGTVDTLDVAVLAALNIASDLLAMRQSASRADPGSKAESEPAPSTDGLTIEPQRVRELVDLIDSLEEI